MTQIDPSTQAEVVTTQTLNLDSTLQDLRMIHFQWDEACCGEELFTILPANMQIAAAVQVCLQRSPERLYEPIVVHIDTNHYQLLSVSDLLVAHTQIHQIAVQTIEESRTVITHQNEQLQQYIQQAETVADAAIAVENETFQPEQLDTIARRTDELGRLARVFQQMVQTVHLRERELSEAKAHWEAILNAVPGSISWIDASGVYIGVNRHLAEKFNLPQDAFVGKEVGFLKGDSKLANFLIQFVASSDTAAETVIDIDSGNTRRYYLLVAQKYQQGDATVSVGIDITDRKLAEEALRIAEENYRSIFENAPEGIFQSSPEGRFIKVNPAMARICGYASPDEMIESITNIAEQLYVDPEKRTEFKDLLATQDFVKKLEYRCYRKDHGIIWAQIDARAVKDSRGQLLYYEGIVQDVTERKQREDELKRQLEELKIEIDPQKRDKEVAILTESNYFQAIQKEIADMNLDEFWS